MEDELDIVNEYIYFFTQQFTIQPQATGFVKTISNPTTTNFLHEWKTETLPHAKKEEDVIRIINNKQIIMFPAEIKKGERL
jgi:hypothetical protein